MRETAEGVLEPPPAPGAESEGDAEERIRPPCSLVIFGASGDLTRRLLAPAIAHLSRDGAISPDFAIIGLARTHYEDQEFRKYLEGGAKEFTPPAQGRPGDFPATVQYIAGDFGDAALYQKLKAALEKIEAKRPAGRNRIFYLATPPEADPAIVKFLGDSGLPGRRRAGPGPWGKSPSVTTSTRRCQLNAELALASFPSGRSTASTTTSAKRPSRTSWSCALPTAIFEPIWNSRFIDHVQITVAETLGVEYRAGYYEERASCAT